MTFFVYGALYVTFFYQAVVLQGVLGYTALGAGLVGIPIGIMLATLSTRIGTLAVGSGSRRFLVAGPILMALGLCGSRGFRRTRRRGRRRSTTPPASSPRPRSSSICSPTRFSSASASRASWRR